MLDIEYTNVWQIRHRRSRELLDEKRMKQMRGNNPNECHVLSLAQKVPVLLQALGGAIPYSEASISE